MVSDNLKSMARDDEVLRSQKRPFTKNDFETVLKAATKPVKKETGPYPELESLMEKALKDFQSCFKKLVEKYGDDSAWDAFMEQDVEFKMEFSQLIANWITQLIPRTEFQRGCVCTLGFIKILLDSIEQLNPGEPE